MRNKIRNAIKRFSSRSTQPSLFHCVRDAADGKRVFSIKEFVGDLFTGFRNPVFIPSVFSNFEGLALDRARGRTRKMEAGMISISAHAFFLSLALFAVHQAQKTLPQNNDTVFLKSPIAFPFDGDKLGGGGGGGNNQPAPATTGRLPAASRVQMLSPDPEFIKPLSAAEDVAALLPSVQIPIDIPQNPLLPIGEFGPPNGSLSYGPGNGGGIGPGEGPGVGPGKGPGTGPGSNGVGGGPEAGVAGISGIHVVGNGVKEPIALYQPRPNYTEAARKAHVEGNVLIHVVIRKDGTVDSFNIMRGLGYGLDDSAISTIASKWRFKPGTLNGKPVDVQAEIEISFRLY